MIPLFVGLAGRRVIIFGGGGVAARKAGFFVKEADVTVISRSHSPEVVKLPVTRTVRDLTGITDGELESIIRGAFIVIAALPDRILNNRIGAVCRKMGILFNNADGDSGDLIIPSVSSGRNYSIAVSTQGKSPTVSRFIREHLDRTFVRLDEMIELQDALRRQLRNTEPSPEKRRAILRDMARDPEVWNALSRSLQDAKDLAKRRYLDG